jgi:hypothetical protein
MIANKFTTDELSDILDITVPDIENPDFSIFFVNKLSHAIKELNLSGSKASEYASVETERHTKEYVQSVKAELLKTANSTFSQVDIELLENSDGTYRIWPKTGWKRSCELMSQLIAFADRTDYPNNAQYILANIQNLKAPLVKNPQSDLHKVPRSVAKIARKALEWRNKFKRGGTEVGINTANILSNSEYVTTEKLEHISRYFPRHEVDKTAPNFYNEENPSKGRIAWDLWGGDAGRDWSRRNK